MSMKAKDLAKLLQVSPATISLVLNNKPGISDGLRHTLIEKIKALGYEDMLHTGNKDFVSPSDKAQRAIAYLIYTDTDDNQERFAFYPAVMEGAEMQARESKFSLFVLHMSIGGNPHLKTLLKNTGAVAAAVQTTKITDQILQDLAPLQIPYVFIDAYRPDLSVSCVCVNNEQGVYTAVKHLKSKGHTNLGYIASGLESDSAVERRKHFHMALREYELVDRISNYYIAGSHTADPTAHLTAQFSEHPPAPSAFIAENDVIAWRSMSVLKKLGYRIPEDISIIGFDDRSVCTMTEPPLTTIRNYRNLMGRQAVTMIKNKLALQLVGLPDMPMKFELPTELIERDSVKQCRRS